MSNEETYQRFKEIEYLKTRFEKDLLSSLSEEIINLRWEEVNSPDHPRDGNLIEAYVGQDQGFRVAIDKVLTRLNLRLG
jgi:hypothetical protein